MVLRFVKEEVALNCIIITFDPFIPVRGCSNNNTSQRGGIFSKLKYSVYAQLVEKSYSLFTPT